MVLFSAPKISELSLDKCLVEWQACKPMGRDTIIYALQLQHKDQEYREVSLLIINQLSTYSI